MQETGDHQKREAAFRSVSAASCGLVLLLAASSLAGYALKNTALAAIFPTSIPMAPSTAFCFALLSVTLLLRARGRLPRAAAYTAALTVLAVSLSALFRSPLPAEKLDTIPLWRMSPFTALLFIISSAGLVRAVRAAGTDRIAAALNGALLVLSFLILTGYMYGSPLFYGGHVIPVAFPTGAAFFALGVALLAANPAALSGMPFFGDSLQAVLFRNFLPLTAAAVLINGFLNLGGRALFGSKPVLNAVSALAAMAVAAWLAKRVSLRVGDRIAQAQQKQAEMEGRMAVLFSNLPGAVYRCANERDWRMEFLSEGCLSLTGYPAAEFTGARPLSFGDIILPEDRDRVWREVQEAVSAGRQYRLTYSIKTRGGAVKTVFDQGMMVKQHGSSGGTLEGYISDITELKRAEEMLTRSNERFTLAARGAGLGIWDWDVQANRLVWDDRMFQLYGAAREEFPGAYEAWLKGLHPDDRARCGKETQAALRGEGEYNTEFRVVWPGGEIRHLRALGEVFRDADGRAVRMVGINYDITDRKRTEAAVQESEARFRQLFERMEEGFSSHEVICDAQGRPVDYRFLDVNPAFERLTGLKRADIVGRTVLEVIPATEKVWIENYGKVALTGVPMHFEEHSAALGKWYEVSAFSPRRGQFAVSFFDITARKRAEAEIRKLNSDLVLKNSELENFLYVTSHDLRSPLVNIQGFGQNLSEYLSAIKDKVRAEASQDCGRELLPLLEQKAPAALNFINESAGKMDRMITALLRLSRLGRAPTQPSKVDMDALLKQTISYFSFQAGQAGAEITCGALPPCLADREAIGQVFSNLIENALKHRHPRRSPKVAVTGRREGSRAVYQVRDNGMGIEASEAEKVWQVFYRANPGAPGEGIGLSIVKTLVEKNGGKAAMESAAGEGTVFTLELPAA